ncbi:hypothetical protein CWB66_03440 [Pseudoalteromonas sp. S558]|nr:hypothetical protein CWB66_03440 [Pseudoalteromonas sp. S558]
MGGAFGLTNLPFDVGRISGKATPSDKNDEFTRNNPTYRVKLMNNRTYALSLDGINRAIKKLS